MTINFSEFNNLPVPAKAALIIREGVLLSERSLSEDIILLYGIDNFYVEVYYGRTTHELSQIQSFQNVDRLEPYLALIDVQGLA